MHGSARLTRLAGTAAALGLLTLAAPAGAAVPVFTPAGPLFTDVSPEAISVSPDGRTVATATPFTGIALVDITDPAVPRVKASLATDQTALAFTKDGRYLLVVDQQLDPERPGGPDARNLRILDAGTLAEVRRIAIPSGDSVDVSPDGQYAAIADEQDQGFNDGSVIVLDMLGREVADWTTRQIALPARDDARWLKPLGVTLKLQPEYIDVRADNVALVSVQDQNAFALVDLVSGTVQKVLDAGSIDTTTFKEREQFGAWDWTAPAKAPRMPDGVAWLPDGKHFLAANEGEKDFFSDGARAIDQGAITRKFGGRGYGVYNADTGALVYDSGLAGERETARRGFYPTSDAGEAGHQYEGAAVARFGESLLGFVVSERGNQLHILDLADPAAPKLLQILATGERPEYVVPIPERNLVLASGESGGLSVFKVAAPGSHAVIPVVPQDPSFEFELTYGFGGNPKSMTYDDGRILFPTDNGVLSVDPDDPRGPNARTVGSHAGDAVPDGAGGYWLRSTEGPLTHVNRAGETVLERADAGTFGGTRIGDRTYNPAFGSVDVYELSTGTSLGAFTVDIPGRNPYVQDTEATPGGDLLFAVRVPEQQAIEVYVLRDPETVAFGSTVKPALLQTLSLGAYSLRRDLDAWLRLAVSPEGRVFIGHTDNAFLELDERLPAYQTSTETSVGGTVPATLSLAIGTPGPLGPFVPGVERLYETTAAATVTSTAGDATLSVGDPGHLVNGAFKLPEPLQVALSKSTWDGPVSNEQVTVGFKQLVKATDALRTGRYSKTVTFTLSTTRP
ncbi:hypothetical protein OJ997_04360 [Solirubrobacter phytolaccae]|uniref:Alkaline phosphatase n=1 Tax=Solirubrobacter phytolaccae TaxID=1404360 RepID=A0A9X3N4K5_9ACTN|nr:hypothetical protein [Solirubrobacter phytolaccae]MDA0179519.1 hypothetical protein [Solirubrobacter phytolaccae]